jgi:class 3 adenylate cyclase/tetratricopeptide (TPR) repeat protein
VSFKVSADLPSARTVLMTDIEESTRLWEHHPDAMEAVVSGHNEIVSGGVARREGRLVKLTGDGALAVFADAAAAVAAAVEIQRELLGRSWPGVGDVGVRIGLDTGVCHDVGGDILGRPPNLASRLQSAGHGGQILVTGATAEACGGRLDDEIQLKEVGPYLIRGFDQPIQIHVVTHPTIPAAFPPLRAPPVGVDDVPPDDVELFGRDEVLASIPAWLQSHRVVTLWGPPGVGKSRIAVRVARTMRRPFDDGVRFVDLARSTSDNIGRVLMGALQAQPNVFESARETVIRTLRPLRVLLVIVHCERMLEDLRDVIAEIEQDCPHTRILATSHSALRCAGEQAVEVRPLPVPREDERSPDALMANPSAQVFVTRLRSVQPGFRLHPSNAQLVAEACRQADGLPLALELAAAHAGLEGLAAPQSIPADLTSRVTDQVALLSASDAELLSHLAVFDGHFSRELAAAIAPDPGRVGTSLEHLVRSALVHVDTTELDRFRLLRPCRHVAWGALSPSAQDALRWRHARAMSERAAAYEPLLRSSEQVTAVQAISSGFAEFRGAVRFLLAQGDVDESSALVTHLFQFCLFQPRPEGHRWATEIAQRLDGSERRAVEVRGAAALAFWFSGDTTRAIELGSRAVDGADADASTVWARTALVNSLGYLGDLASVAPHFGALVNELRNSPDPYWQINGLGYESISLTMFGRVDDAIAKADHALDLARDLGNPDAMHWALYALGRATARDDPHGACEAFEQAMTAALQVDSKFNVGLDLVEWTALQRRLDRPRLAARGASDLLDLVAVSGNRAQLSQAILEAGLVLAAAGCAEPAAVALLARRGLPTMPTGSAEAEDSECLDRLARDLGSTWSRLRVRARALTEPDLVDLCRTELAEVDEVDEVDERI